MKITRFHRVRGFRIFHNFTWPTTLPEFGQFNLIYGWNGSGKTTISQLFRHLEIKQRLDIGDAQYVIDDKTISDIDLTAATLPQVRVFNRDAIDRTVFEVPGKQLSPIYFLGADSVEKQREIEVLKKKLKNAEEDHVLYGSQKSTAEKERESFCTAEARAIKNLLTTAGGGTYNNYDSRSYKQSVQRLRPSAASFTTPTAEEIAAYVTAKDARYRDKVSLVSEDFPNFEELANSVTSLLSRSVGSNILSELTEDPSVSNWVYQGLALHEGEHQRERCRFCEQPIPPERIAKLNAHFNDQFNQFQKELSQLVEKIEASKNQIDAITFPDKGLLYEQLAAQYEEAVVAFGQHRSSMKQFLEVLITALHAKRDRPFEIMELRSFSGITGLDGKDNGWFLTILDALGSGIIRYGAQSGQAALQSINQQIKFHNTHTDNFETSIATARRKLEEANVMNSLPRLLELDEACNAAESNAEGAKERAKQLRTQIENLEREIRKHQRPAEELNAEMHSYLGRSELQFVVKDTGYVISRNGQPAMHLSEGERTAIAFMYFLKSLQDTTFDLKSGIVVIDDPVSSLDANSLYSAFGFMKSRTRNVGQLFILTHNFTFFRQVRQWFYKLPGQNKKDHNLQPAKFYMLATSMVDGKRNATLTQLDPLLHRYESEYHYLFKLVFDVVSHGSSANELEASYSMPNVARRLLESFLAFRLPGNPGELHQQLEEITFDVAKKARILRFLHTHSHYGQIAEPEHDLSVLSESQGVLIDLMALIQKIDPDHYAGMVKIMTELSAAA